jgi:hypothetical protein
LTVIGRRWQWHQASGMHQATSGPHQLANAASQNMHGCKVIACISIGTCMHPCRASIVLQTGRCSHFGTGLVAVLMQQARKRRRPSRLGRRLPCQQRRLAHLHSRLKKAGTADCWEPALPHYLLTITQLAYAKSRRAAAAAPAELVDGWRLTRQSC